MATNRVRELVEEFADKLEELLKQDLRDTIDRVGLGFVSARSSPSPSTNGHRVVGRGKGIKRDSAALDALSARFTSFVSKNPGLRIEQINKELGTTTKDLALPIRKLISDGAIKTSGQKRSTTYTAGGRGGGKTKPRSKK